MAAVLVSSHKGSTYSPSDLLNLSFGIYSQEFTTGSSAAGYTLTEVRLPVWPRFSRRSRTPPRIRLHKTNETGEIVARLDSDTRGSGDGVYIAIYRPEEGIKLDPSTTYHLQVLNHTYIVNTHPNIFQSPHDVTGLTGWSMADNARYRPNGGEWGDSTGNSPLRFVLRGDVIPYIHIAAERPKATGKLDDITYTLTRGGDTTAQAVLVTLTPPTGNDWNMPAHSLVRLVNFDANSNETDAFFPLSEMDSDATMSGTVTASLGDVDGYDTSHTADVEVVAVPVPVWTFSLVPASLRHTEGGSAQSLRLLATAASADMPAPNLTYPSLRISSTDGGTAGASDFISLNRSVSFGSNTFSRNADGVMVGEVAIPLDVLTDTLVEGDETIGLSLRPDPRAPALFGFQGADGMVSTTSASAEAVIADDDFGVVSITRQTPSNELTSADSLTWRVTFSMPVSNVDATDFTVTGSTATMTVTAVSGVTGAWDVAVSGGNLADFNGLVTLDFASSQNIQNADRAALSDTTPAGTNDNFYNVDNNPRAPDAPGSLTAAPGNGRVSLSWTAAAENNSPILLYEYRSKAGSGPFGSWTIVPDSNNDGLLDTRVTVTSLMNRTTYTFEVRARSLEGAGVAASVTATPLLPITIAADRPKATGKLDSITYTLTRAGDTTAAQAVTVTLTPPAGNDWNVPRSRLTQTATFTAGSATATLTINLTAGRSGGSWGLANNATTSGTLTASLGAISGYDTSDTAEVMVVVLAAPLWTISMDPASLRVTEGDGEQTLRVLATAASADMPAPSADGLVSFAIGSTRTGTAQSGAVDSGADFLPLSEVKSMPVSAFRRNGAGVMVGAVNVTLNVFEDTLLEGDETVGLSLGPSPGASAVISYQGADGMVNATRATAEAVITDNDFGLVSVARQTPSSSPTNADSLTWRVTFSENVKNVTAADFKAAGTTATLAVSEKTAFKVYDVTASDGDLAGLNATVTLSFASNQDIKDLADNALTATTPSGANDNTYAVDNTAPAFTSAAVTGTSLVITMNETLAAAASLANGAFGVKKTPSGGAEETVSLSSTTAPVINSATVTLTLATALSPTDTDVKVTYTKPDTGSDNKLADTAGNEAATFTAQPVTNIAVPGAPGGLTATPGKVQITLSWTAAAANNSAITNYQYRYKAASGSFGNWTDVPDSDDSGANLDDETSVTVTGLTNGTAYTFEVRAVNGVGDGAAAEVTATTANVPPTAADETFSTKEDSDRAFSAEAFNFSDDDPDDVLAAVKITALLAANTGSLLLDGNAVTLNQTISKADLDAGKLVYMPPANANGTGYAAFSFKVNDGEADSASAYTMTIDVTAVNDTPTVANAIPGQSAMVGTAFSYTIPSDTFADSDTDDTLSYTATLADGGLLPDWLSFAATTRILSGTPPASAAAAPVSVRVTARDEDGAGVSAPLVVTVAPAVPEAPQSLAASAGNAQVVLSWSAPSGDGGAAITKYQYRSAQGASVDASVNWNDIPDSADTGSSAADETTVTVSSLTNGTAYAFEVRAVNSAGNGTAASSTTTPAATDSVAPAVTSITRRVPAASPTNADSLTWRVVFSEAVRNAGSAAFSVTGTGIGTPSVSAAAVSGQTGVHDVTVSGATWPR